MTAVIIEAPFEIGRTYYRVADCPRRVTVACPICNGQKFVTLILGSGEQMRVECEACGLGCENARGYIEEWEREPKIEAVKIAKALRFDGGTDWSVELESGQTTRWDYLFSDEAEAMARAIQQSAQLEQDNIDSRLRRKQHAAGKTTWHARYHREQIRDLERKLAWHRAKLVEQGKKP